MTAPAPPRLARLGGRLAALGAAAVLLYLLFFHHTGQRDLWSSHEGRAAQHGERILATGEWVHLTLSDGRPELQKPPLFYWLVASVGWLQQQLGQSLDGTTVRLPSAGAALLSLAAVGTWLWQQRRPRAALLAMLLLATMIRFTWLARVGRIDMPLTAASAWAIVAFLLAAQSRGWPRQAWLLVGWLALAAAVLLKGPIGLVLPGLVLTCLALVDRTRRDASQDVHAGASQLGVWFRSLAWGLPLLLALTLPWFLAMDRATDGAFFHEFFVRHNLQRGMGGDEQLDGHVHPPWFYVAQLGLDALPWSWLVPLALVLAWRQPTLRSPQQWVGWVWFLALLAFLSLMRYKRPDYLLPAYPGLAIALGSFLDCWLAQASPERVRRAVRGLAIAACGCAVGWWAYVDLLLPRWEPGRELRSFAAAVRSHSPVPTQIILFRIDSHHLVWLLGPSTERLWEWENLEWWSRRPARVYFIMPRHWAERCVEHLPPRALRPVLSIEEVVGQPHTLPLVLLTNDPALTPGQPGDVAQGPDELLLPRPYAALARGTAILTGNDPRRRGPLPPWGSHRHGPEHPAWPPAPDQPGHGGERHVRLCPGVGRNRGLLVPRGDHPQDGDPGAPGRQLTTPDHRDRFGAAQCHRTR